jgi:hypothetical protein
MKHWTERKRFRTPRIHYEHKYVYIVWQHVRVIMVLPRAGEAVRSVWHALRMLWSVPLTKITFLLSAHSTNVQRARVKRSEHSRIRISCFVFSLLKRRRRLPTSLLRRRGAKRTDAVNNRPNQLFKTYTIQSASTCSTLSPASEMFQWLPTEPVWLWLTWASFCKLCMLRLEWQSTCHVVARGSNVVQWYT